VHLFDRERLAKSAWFVALLTALLMASACARGARPVATEETRERASEQGTSVLGQRIVRPALDTSSAPELLPNFEVEEPLPLVDGATQLQTSSANPDVPSLELAVLEEPSPEQTQHDGNVSQFPYAPVSTAPRVDNAWIECGAQGLRLWTVVSPAGLSVTTRVELPTDSGSVVYESAAVSASNGATPGEWRPFPGDPSERLDQIDALCLASTWPMHLTVHDADGDVQLRAALQVDVSDEGWTDTHLGTLPVLIPRSDVPVVPVPWRATNGMQIGAVVLQCTDTSVVPLLEVSSGQASVVETRQFVSIAGSQTWPRSYTASGRVADETISELTEWMDTGAPVEEEIVREICAAETWRVYVAVSDGGDSQIKVLVEAPVLKAVSPSR